MELSLSQFVTHATSVYRGEGTKPSHNISERDMLHTVGSRYFSGSKHTTAMGKVYMGIIRAAQPVPIGDWTVRFQKCVGAIVLLHDPLPCAH